MKDEIDLETLRHRIGMLRQWFNERPQNSPLLTNSDIEHWLFGR
jgi:hypothetical protein